MKVFFVGSPDGRSVFQSALSGYAQLTMDKDADCCIIEIADAESLNKLPNKFRVPTFFFISKKDRKIFDLIKDFKITGIFFPPLKDVDIVKKIMTLPKEPVVKQSGEFDTLKAKIIAKAENIPPLPSLARELVRLTRNDKTLIKDFVEQIKKDQGLSSRIIKLVNSPFYGLRQEISSIDRATVLLGLNTVKNLALAVSTESFYNKNFSLLQTTGKAIWEHSFGVARLCDALAKLTGDDEDALYLAGLMHDMGKTVIVDFLVKEAVTVEDEQAQLGIDHCAVGELVLTKWFVAKYIGEAVRTHHRLNKSRFSQVLYFANLLELSKDRADEQKNIAADCAEVLGINHDTVVNIALDITETGQENPDEE